MNGPMLNIGKASLRRVEHPKMRGEAYEHPNISTTDGQVMNLKSHNVQYKTIIGSIAI